MQKIEPPNNAEMAWIAENLDRAKSIAEQYTGSKAEELVPAVLDRTLSAWRRANEGVRPEPNVIANALGIAFGHFLARELGLDWAVVSDEYGTDMALHGSPGDILLFPTSSVAKRIAAGENVFFNDLFQHMSADITRLRRQVH